MNIFKKSIKNEGIETVLNEKQIEDVLLKALIRGEEITRNEALAIPAISSAVSLICDSFAMIPFKLYEKTNNNGEKQTKEIEDDRVSIINKDTNDTLDGFQFKKAICEDYLLGKGGYAYINKEGNRFIGLNYVECDKIAILKNSNPIFKNVELQINGKKYDAFQFIKLLRNSKDGASGIGYTKQINRVLQTAYNQLIYELNLMKSNGTKKGFIKAQKRLDKKGIEDLKKSWTDYVNGTSSCIILNEGMDFKEASNTSVENQLNEKSKTFSEEIKDIFHIGKNNDDFIRYAVMPPAIAFATALNRDFLLEKEKKSLYFAPDFTELSKTSIKDRYDAYKIAVETGFMTRNEVRYKEDMDALAGLDLINLGLGDVLYDPKTKQIYTPNTNRMVKMEEK